MLLEKGTLVAQRFEIEQIAGKGGMGVVYRSYDQLTQQHVALKLLHQEVTVAHEVERFAREAELLAELKHANIVAYVAHGETADGQHYLAMEWLAGVDLAHRLAASGLSLQESMSCIRAAADGLTAAHRLGIVHRDIKPSNLFLREGQVRLTTLLDFGIAKLRSVEAAIQSSDQVDAQPLEPGIGTPLYISPEQARGDPDVGASADIFSLGCVLYECLAGRPPFRATHSIAVLARILFEDAIPVRALRKEVPQVLEDLLSRMLAKDPRQRPQDATELLREIDRLDSLVLDSEHTEPLLPGWSKRWLHQTEQRLVGMLVSTPIAGDRQAIQDVVGAFAGRAEWLLDGSVMVLFANPSLQSAIDLANQAARCALEMVKLGSVFNLALSICLANAITHVPSGDLTDRAVSLLGTRLGGKDSERPGEIYLDSISAALLSRRFTVLKKGSSVLLGAERQDANEPGSYSGMEAGRRTSVLGRESEIGALDSLFHFTVDESEPHLAFVTGPPGTGKTRLVQEFLQRLRGRGEAVQVLTGRGDSSRSKIPYGTIEHLPSSPPFLLSDWGDVLKQARLGKASSHDVLRGTFIDWLRALAQASPLLLVIDDEQWADALSLSVIGGAIHQLSESPLLVLLVSRRDEKQIVTIQTPSFAELEVHEIVLKGLSRRACERLVSQTMGQELANESATRIIELSGGNPLFLEELMLAVKEGKEASESETVIALLQAQFGGLPTLARRILQAASIFGLKFWRGGLVGFLADDRDDGSELDAGLRMLEEAEFIERQTMSQLVDEAEYCFRHALIRRAAYELLGAVDRTVGEIVIQQWYFAHPKLAAHGKPQIRGDG